MRQRPELAPGLHGPTSAAVAGFAGFKTTSGKNNGLQHRCCNPFDVLAEWTGLEPATPGVTGRYSNQLNYHSLRWLRCRIAPQVQPNLSNVLLASPRGFEPLYRP